MKPPQRGVLRAFLFAVVLVSSLGWAKVRLFAAESGDQAFKTARSDFMAAVAIEQKDRKIEALRQCINKFEQIVKRDGSGKSSDKCFYMIAQCHHRIHDLTHGMEDLKAARENYRTVVQRFPSSPLADDAQFLTGILYMAEDPAQAYIEFSKVGIYFPKGDMRPKAEQMMAQLEKRLGYDKGKKSGSSGENVSSRVQKGRPNSASSASGASSLSISSGASLKSAQRGAGALSVASSSRSLGARAEQKSNSTLNKLKRIQHWSGPDYTRVVLYMSDPVTFKEQTTQADPKSRQPGRICLDLKNCVLTSKVRAQIEVMDSFLREIHSAQIDGVQARVVLDTEPIESYRIFSMADPFRLVIDIRGRKSKPELPAHPVETARAPHPASDPQHPPAPLTLPPKLPSSAPSLAKQLGLGVRRIVIDPGHGGRDKGAISADKVYEKDITLAIAKELKSVLEAQTGCEVVLTRSSDRYLSLEERTAIANTKKADLFISIHTNAHEDRSLHGVETYFLNLSKDKESARVAALENATTSKKISDLETILQDLMLHTKINESSHLASDVQCHIVEKLKSCYDGVHNLGIKQAPFYVLLGAEMPSILIETAFLTNQREEQRLKDSTFRENLAKGISAGICDYIRQMKGFAKAGDRQ